MTIDEKDNQMAGWNANEEKLLALIVLSDDLAKRLSDRAGEAFFRAFIVQDRATGEIRMNFRFRYRDGDSWFHVSPKAQMETRAAITYLREGMTDVQPKSGAAMVPLVPPEAYPARGLDLAKHFVLWEVEDWDASPPEDPMLLKPIGGNLCAVLYQWNLTDIERAIIAGTRR